MISWNDLEIFEDANRRLGKKIITIAKRKMITLNSGFTHFIRDEIKDKNYIILAYSKNNKAIVLKFTDNKEEPGAIKYFKGQGKDSQASNIQISAVAFFNHLNVSMDEICGTYEPEETTLPDNSKAWVIFFEKMKK